MKYSTGGSAVLVQVFMLTLFSLALYVFLHSAANTTAVATLRYAHEREQQASHGLFLYGVAYAKEQYDHFMPGEREKKIHLEKWPELEHKIAQLTFRKQKSSVIIDSMLSMHDKTIKEHGIVQLQASGGERWQVTEWHVLIE